MPEISLIAHNLRSTHNVGSLLRTAEGLGITKVYLTGYTPYPAHEQDARLPHLARKLTGQIHKTALGAESLVSWEHREDVFSLIARLKEQGQVIAALEQTKTAQDLAYYRPPANLALVVGREAEGIEAEVLAACDLALEIPMRGQKESFNVVQAAAMALYHLSQAQAE